MMKAEPQKEHAWLQRLAGEWTLTSMTPAPEGFDGSNGGWVETARLLNGVWLVSEGRGTMPGCGETTTQLTLGYDPAKQRYVGTWIGSMMTHLWVYEGSLDEAENKLVLDCEGPAMGDPGKTAKYQDIYELRSDDHRVLTSRIQQDDGTWQEFMTAHYHRKS